MTLELALEGSEATEGLRSRADQQKEELGFTAPEVGHGFQP